jgi:hypothetical protein
MFRFAPPKLECRVVCVTSDNGDPGLAAIVSSYFSTDSTYFAVFKFPRVDQAYKAIPRFEDDGFFSQTSASETATRINNALVGTPVERILLVGLTEFQKTYFGLIPSKMKFEIDDISDLQPNLAFMNREFAGDLACRGNQIARGLLVAKRANKRLTITEAASQLPAIISGPGNGLVVLESKNDISDVIAVNYAFAIGADVTFCAGQPLG